VSHLAAIVLIRHYLGMKRHCTQANHLLMHSRQRLETAEKLASLGAMSAGIALTVLRADLGERI